MARGRAGRECLDDDHTATATWTCRLVVILSIGGFALGRAKVARYAEREHHKDRLMHPLQRVGAKG